MGYRIESCRSKVPVPNPVLGYVCSELGSSPGLGGLSVSSAGLNVSSPLIKHLSNSFTVAVGATFAAAKSTVANQVQPTKKAGCVEQLEGDVFVPGNACRSPTEPSANDPSVTPVNPWPNEPM